MSKLVLISKCREQKCAAKMEIIQKYETISIAKEKKHDVNDGETTTATHNNTNNKCCPRT